MKPHLQYIDCVRGYAILMVITCHLAFVFPELPYPVHRVVVAGWFGVQMFFVASTLTLLKSWRTETERHGRVDLVGFFLRRFFRIAPAYYLAALLYVFIDPPSAGYDPQRIGLSLGFLNALSPAWALGTQSIVPGGWSIGAEFAFYAALPFFARAMMSARGALFVFGGALLFGLAANRPAEAWLGQSLSRTEMAEGLFFWFPNEASVFAMGGLAYVLIDDKAGRASAWVKRHGALLAWAAVAGFLLLTHIRMGAYLGDRPLIPATLAVSAVFVVFVAGLSGSPPILVNRPAAMMGKVSFSAYLLHFAILRGLGAFSETIHARATGFKAIAAFAASWPVVVAATFACSWVTFNLVEEPMMRVGKHLATRLRPRPEAPSASLRS